MSDHPLFKIDESEFAKNFNLTQVLAKVALGVLSALIVRECLYRIDKFFKVKRDNII